MGRPPQWRSAVVALRMPPCQPTPSASGRSSRCSFIRNPVMKAGSLVHYAPPLIDLTPSWHSDYRRQLARFDFALIFRRSRAVSVEVLTRSGKPKSAP